MTSRLTYSRISCYITVAAMLAGPAIALGTQYDLSWYTIDGGGGTITGGGFTLSGTIGQPDAQMPPVMNGGAFQLTSGFWAGISACSLPGDMNLDGHVDGDDIQPFVNCLILG